jgi:hypothetical protein
MRSSRVKAATSALAVLCASALAQAECSKDVDCPGDQICVNDSCTEPSDTPLVPSAAAEPNAPRVISSPRVISVEIPPLEVQPHLERRNLSLVLGGAIATAVGLAAVGVGVASSGSTCYYELGDGFQVEHCERSPNYAAYAIGGVLIAGGIPLIVFGAQKVLVRPEAQVAPWLSPQGGGLALRLTL